MTRPPVKIHKRKTMSGARKARIHQACLGRCEECQAPLPVIGPEVAYDHIIPLKAGGADEDHNFQILCSLPCHLIKTRNDVAAIAKAKRLAGETCNQPTKRPLRSRGFAAVCRKLGGGVGLTKRAQREGRA